MRISILKIGVGALVLAVTLSFVAESTSTYLFQVRRPDPGTEVQSVVLTSRWWGIVRGDGLETNCLSNAFDEVQYRRRVQDVIMGIVTFGAIMQVEVQWRCAKPTSEEGAT